MTVERRLLAATSDGPLPRLDGPQLVTLLRAAGLTGRGGAGFPVWRKLEAVRPGPRAVVIGNGAEGEPASGKDKALLTCRPHLVLDGLQLMSRAINAQEAHMYVQSAALAAVRAALEERRAAGLDVVPVKVTVAPDAFVSGEESAVVNAVAGRPAVPSDKRIRITQAGLGGAPTLVQNVETLAHVASIARYGPAWFRESGTGDEPGTFLATVGGAVTAPGVLEAGYGVRLGDLVDAAGGPSEPLQAVLVGGYHGGWVPAWPELEVSRAGLAAYGASPGAGIVLALPASACGLAETARIAGYLAGQSAGQCGPCVNGLPRLASALASQESQEVARLSALVEGRGACRHPDGTVRLVRSAMRMFESEVAAHRAGHCTARGNR